MPLSILNSDNVLNVGTVANDNTGDNLRTAGQKINANFEDLDSAVAAIVTLPEATVANSTIRYDGVAYASTDGLKVDASGNTTVAGTLDVTGTTSVADLSVTGPATFSDSASFSTHVNLDDSAKLRLGDNSEFEIYHTAAGASVISETGGGNLEVRANQLNVLNADGTETMLTAQPDNAVTLYYDNNPKFATTDSGVSVVGNITVTGNVNQANGVGFPSGTAMLFQQSAAPTGWTKQTTHNNKALRVVSGSVTTGGNVDFETAFSASRTVSGSVGDHTLTLSEIPSHNHGSGTLGVADHTHTFSGGSYNVSRFDGNFDGGKSNSIDRDAPNEGDFTQFTITVPNSTGGSGALGVSGSTADEGSDGSHNHGWSGSVNLDVQYVDLIIATKD